MALRPPSAFTMSIVASSSSDTQSHKMLPSGINNREIVSHVHLVLTAELNFIARWHSELGRPWNTCAATYNTSLWGLRHEDSQNCPHKPKTLDNESLIAKTEDIWKQASLCKCKSVEKLRAVWIRKARCPIPTFGSVLKAYKPGSYLVHLFIYGPFFSCVWVVHCCPSLQSIIKFTLSSVRSPSANHLAFKRNCGTRSPKNDFNTTQNSWG